MVTPLALPPSPNSQAYVSGSLSASMLPAAEKLTASGAEPESGVATMLATGWVLPPIGPVQRMRRTWDVLIAT